MAVQSDRRALRLWPFVGIVALAGCTEPFDFDLRSLGDTFDTSEAAQNVADRPRPDQNGVITYPTYQVAVARRNETVTQIAGRLGYDAALLARLNAIGLDTPLRRGAIIALPERAPVAASTAATAPVTTPDISVTDLAEAAINNADQGTAPDAEAAVQPGPEPIRHEVERGETAFTIARLYNVPVASLARWNGLGPEFLVREGQTLLIPVEAVTARAQPNVVTAPGDGSETPEPPSADDPLPQEDEAAATAEAPATENLAEDRTAASTSDKPFVAPADGAIIRAYARGRNEGIDIGAPAGADVRAAGAGTVAAVSEDTNGVTILVIRHSDGLLTVYTNIDNLSVARGDRVSRGQSIAKVREGNPSFVHFEVRRGLESVDPADYIP